VYRSLDHRALREFCLEVVKPTPSARFQRYAPAEGFDAGLRAFASLVPELQERRHEADYDPTIRIKTSDARLVIEEARSAIRRFSKVSAARRKTFLLLLLFTPRHR
jgi:ATP phosphoribosyltransferase regulatory subunit HisZ